MPSVPPESRIEHDRNGFDSVTLSRGVTRSLINESISWPVDVVSIFSSLVLILHANSRAYFSPLDRHNDAKLRATTLRAAAECRVSFKLI